MNLCKLNNNDYYFACLVVQKACVVSNYVQKRLNSSSAILKKDQSPVTVADYAVQATINLILKENLDDTFLMTGEETSESLKDPNNSELLSLVIEAVNLVCPGASSDLILEMIDVGDHNAVSNLFWTLDPIDGTKGFLRGDQYAIALGLIKDGNPHFGVLGCPNLTANVNVPDAGNLSEGVVLFACSGQGSFILKSSENNVIEGLKIEARKEVAGNIRFCASVERGHSNRSAQDNIIEKFSTNSSKVYVDSQCKYALVASGNADVYLRLPTVKDYRERIWDHAAGALIAQESGAIVTDVRGNRLDFSHGRLLEKNKGVVCAIPSVHSNIIDILKNLDLGKVV